MSRTICGIQAPSALKFATMQPKQNDRISMFRLSTRLRTEGRGPADAKWLSAEERATLEGALRREAEAREAMIAAGPRPSVLSLVLSRNMLILSFCFGCMV